MSEHPFLGALAAQAAVTINDEHNKKMLARNEYIPWWKRHLLLVILLTLAAPSLLILMFVWVVNATDPSEHTGFAIGQVLGWVIPIGLVLFFVVSYRRAEKRWKRKADQPTTVVEVRRGP